MNESRKPELCDCDVIHEDLVEAVRGKLETQAQYDALAALLKVFSDPTRVKLLHALEHQALCVCDLAALLGVTKSAVSHQLKTLRMSNLVKSRRQGQIVFYSLADDHVKQIIDIGFAHLWEEE